MFNLFKCLKFRTIAPCFNDYGKNGASRSDGKNAKTCALAIIAAEKAGIITHPSYAALRDEFPEISRRNNYDYFFSRPDNYEKDVESIRIALS